jgi:hypothetical protein
MPPISKAALLVRLRRLLQLTAQPLQATAVVATPPQPLLHPLHAVHRVPAIDEHC